MKPWEWYFKGDGMIFWGFFIIIIIVVLIKIFAC